MWLKAIKKRFENSSPLVCNVCVRKIKNCCDNLEFISKCFESDQKDNVGGEFEIVYARARKQSDVDFNQNRLMIDINLILASQSRFLRVECERKQSFLPYFHASPPRLAYLTKIQPTKLERKRK